MKRINFDKYRLLELLSPLIGLFISFIFFIIIVVSIGENPFTAMAAIYKFTFSSTPKIATIFSVAIPLFFSGLAAAVAFQAGIFNIGVEGQYLFGGFVGAVAGIYLKLPVFIHIPVIVIFSMAGGALWALIPALLKVKKGVHEVITTIMLNNIAMAVVNFFVNGPLSGITPGTSIEPRTLKIRPTAVFEKLNWLFRAVGLNIPDYVYLDYSLIVAIIAAVVTGFIVYKTRYGFEIRAVGTSENVSLYSGIKVKKVQILVFLLSGGIAGLIGLQEIFAIRGFYTFNIASGLGFDGIAVALIGQNSPIGVVFASLLFAFLKQAGYGLQLFTSVPNSGIYVITGLMIIFIVVTNELFKKYIRALRRKESS
jgi:general nucleoside transport system permease protein